MTVREAYDERLRLVKEVVVDRRKTNWDDFDSSEKLLVQNLVLLVGMLYSMFFTS